MLNRFKVLSDKNEEIKGAIIGGAFQGVSDAEEIMRQNGFPEEVIQEECSNLFRWASWSSTAEASSLDLASWADRMVEHLSRILDPRSFEILRFGPQPSAPFKHLWDYVPAFSPEGMKRGEFVVMGYLIKMKGSSSVIAYAGVTSLGRIINAEAELAKMWKDRQLTMAVRGKV
jgi:hypothetical protein